MKFSIYFIWGLQFWIYIIKNLKMPMKKHNVVLRKVKLKLQLMWATDIDVEVLSLFQSWFP